MYSLCAGYRETNQLSCAFWTVDLKCAHRRFCVGCRLTRGPCRLVTICSVDNGGPCSEAGQWHHLSCTYNENIGGGVRRRTLYKDGVQFGQDNPTSSYIGPCTRLHPLLFCSICCCVLQLHCAVLVVVYVESICGSARVSTGWLGCLLTTLLLP